MPSLRLIIEFPGFYVDIEDDAEDVAAAMNLEHEGVVCAFAGRELEQSYLRALEGQIVGYEVHRRADEPGVGS